MKKLIAVLFAYCLSLALGAYAQEMKKDEPKKKSSVTTPGGPGTDADAGAQGPGKGDRKKSEKTPKRAPVTTPGGPGSDADAGAKGPGKGERKKSEKTPKREPVATPGGPGGGDDAGWKGLPGKKGEAKK